MKQHVTKLWSLLVLAGCLVVLVLPHSNSASADEGLGQNNRSCFARHLPKPDHLAFSTEMKAALAATQLFQIAQREGTWSAIVKSFVDTRMLPKFTVCLFIDGATIKDLELKNWELRNSVNTYGGPLLILTEAPLEGENSLPASLDVETQFFNYLLGQTMRSKYGTRCDNLDAESMEACIIDITKLRSAEERELKDDFENQSIETSQEIVIIELFEQFSPSGDSAGVNLARFLDRVSVREKALAPFLVSADGHELSRNVHDPLVHATVKGSDGDLEWIPSLEDVVLAKIHEMALQAISERQVEISRGYLKSSEIVFQATTDDLVISSERVRNYSNLSKLSAAAFWWLCEEDVPRLVSRLDVSLQFREILPTVDLLGCNTGTTNGKLVIYLDDFQDIDVTGVELSLSLLSEAEIASELKSELIKLQGLVLNGNVRLRRILEFTGNEFYEKRIEQTRERLEAAKEAVSKTGIAGIFEAGKALTNLSQGFGSILGGMKDVRKIFLDARETKKDNSYLEHYWGKRKDFNKHFKSIDAGWDKTIKGWNALEPYLDSDARREARETVRKLEDELRSHRAALKEFNSEISEQQNQDETELLSLASRVRAQNVRVNSLGRFRQQVATDLLLLQTISYLGSNQFDQRRDRCHTAILQEANGENSLSLELVSACPFGRNMKDDLRGCVVAIPKQDKGTVVSSATVSLVLSEDRNLSSCFEDAVIK